MRTILIIFSILLIMSSGKNANGQDIKREDWTVQKAKTWINKAEWKNGWNIKAHPSINTQELAYQYHKNKELWDKAFIFLKNTNLNTITPGKYVLDGDNLYVTISEGPVKNFEATKWEAHKKYIDIQYIIQGKEKMGKIPLEKVSVLEKFDDTKDVGFYTAPEKEAKYYEATPEAFLIFFPGEAHRPSIKVEGFDADKKIVVKIKAN